MPPFSEKAALDKQMLPVYRNRLRHLSFAILVGAFAVLLRAGAEPLLGNSYPFIIAFPATAAAALAWGAGPGLATASVCALGVWLAGTPAIAAAQQPVLFRGFAVVALMTALLCDRVRRSRSFEDSPIVRATRETPLSAWLRAVLWGAFLVPLLAFVAASWWSLDRAEDEAKAGLWHACDLAYRQADRTLSIALNIASRADQASRAPEVDARAEEFAIHRRLSDLTAGIDSIVNANVWDASGSVLARSDAYPVNRAFTIADRGYFRRLQAAPLPVAISEVMVGRQTGKALFNVAIRRQSVDGSFDGIVSVALAPSSFSEYYQTLARDETTLTTFALVRNDGAVLARWPADTDPGYLRAGSPAMNSVTTGLASGQLTIDTGEGRGTQMVVFRRVGALPVYVVTGVSRAAMLGNWARFEGVLAAILAPTTAGLVYVTWVALRKTRREAAVSFELQNEISARAESERRVLDAQRLETLSLVTGSVAHDLNNMLAVITSSLHVHKIHRPEVAGDKTLAAISRSVQAGVRLTRQLLSFSKKQALRPEIIHFQTWLPAADALLRSTLGSTAKWTSRVDEQTRPVRVDPGELELALLNLVLNAKLAMPRGGELSVHVSNDAHASEDAPMVVVCVTDTGEGIAPDVLSRVFEPFFTTRQKGVGSGLGLTQVQGFCDQSGGRITIESVVGQGTTLCMHLPAYVEATVPPVQDTPAFVGRLEAELLLVEDNDEVARTTEQMLTASGLSVVRVASADAALAYLATAPSIPDVVLSDIAMPGSMNGIGLALALRHSHPGLPVILNTGYAEQIEAGTAKGMRVFQKPVPPDVLLTELASLLRREPASG